MTPIARFLERHLPPPLVLPALVAIYAGLLLALIVVPGTHFDTVYIDG